jgi:hypothetical protein
MPFGKKMDAAGRVTNFDSVYEKIIAPAVARAGLEPIRADDERIGGTIHKPMFERLMLCHYAVVDITGANPNEAAQAAPEPAAAALRRVTEAARTQIDNIERSARFRSNRDKTLFGAHYYCFVAGAIVALLPPERQPEITLESFGNTVGCKDAGRTE